jgi:putative ABC transport system permease protein
MSWQTKLRALFRREKLDSDMAEEMRLHLELQATRNAEQGMAPEEARYAAQRQFGNVASLYARVRDEREGFAVRQLAQLALDLRFGVRQLLKHRWFSAAIVSTLALGIGINTTVFTLVNAVLFKPVPVPGGERLVAVVGHKLSDRDSRFGIAYPDFVEFQRRGRAFERLEAASAGQAVISENGNPPEGLRLNRVSTGLFAMLRTPPVLGREFAEEDGRAGAEPVALIGHHVWQARYGGKSDVIGRVVRVDGTPTTIVGVMPEGFKFPKNEDLWLPLVPDGKLLERSNQSLRLFGILRKDAAIADARTELATIAARLAAEFPASNKDLSPLVLTFHEAYNGGPVRVVFLMLLGAVAFVLMIACANVTNMLLIRTLARHRELSVRAAMGASRWQIVRQLLVESVLLSTVGGVCGLGLSWFGVRAFALAARNSPVPYWVEFQMDYLVFGYFAAISIFSGLAFGLVPALRASRIDLNQSLKDGAPAASAGRGQLAGALVVLQFALTVVLLAGAGMMMRSFFAAEKMNEFIPAERILTAWLTVPSGSGQRYADLDARRRFFSEVVSQMAALPGVTHAAAASNLPGMGSAAPKIEIEGQPSLDPRQAPRVFTVVQTPGFLPTIGLPVLAGRGFEDADGEMGRENAVITRAFATKYWPDRPAVGQRFRFLEGRSPGPWMTVVGVSADFVQNPTEQGMPPAAFVTHRQDPRSGMALLLRTPSDPASLASALRATMQKIDAGLPLSAVATLPAVYERDHWHLRAFGMLFLVFSLAALLMASIGIYAVVAHASVRRTREIGIRIALGATAASIRSLVLVRGVRQLFVGLAIGFVGAAAATRLMGSADVLFRVSDRDPLVFGGVAALLVTVGLIACWLPARRAAKVDPMVALRCE